MAYELMREARGIYCKYSGHCDLKELLQAFVSYSEQPDFETVRYALHDFSAIDDFSYTEDVMVDISAHTVGASLSNQKLVPAVIATDAQALAVLAHYKALTKRHVELFSTLEEARKWAATQ